MHHAQVSLVCITQIRHDDVRICGTTVGQFRDACGALRATRRHNDGDAAALAAASRLYRSDSAHGHEPALPATAAESSLLERDAREGKAPARNTSMMVEAGERRLRSRVRTCTDSRCVATVRAHTEG